MNIKIIAINFRVQVGHSLNVQRRKKETKRKKIKEGERIMTVKEIVNDYLKKNGFDGLFNDDEECYCDVDCMCDRDGVMDSCRAVYKHESPETCPDTCKQNCFDNKEFDIYNCDVPRKEKEMKVGTKVKMVNCLEVEKYQDRIWVTKSEIWQLRSGEWVVLLEGYQGGFAVNKLEVVE